MSTIHLLCKGESIEVNRIFRCRDQVYKLTHLCLVADLKHSSALWACGGHCDSHPVEEFQQVDVVLLSPEVGLNEMVDGALEHEGVVDGDVPDPVYAIPAGLASSCDRLVHHVVRDEEEGLELGEPGVSMIRGERPRERTSSMHHPKTAARKYSASDRSEPLRMVSVSTTLIPRFSLPPGVL
jgi:hypothetical protein